MHGHIIGKAVEHTAFLLDTCTIIDDMLPEVTDFGRGEVPLCDSQLLDFEPQRRLCGTL